MPSKTLAILSLLLFASMACNSGGGNQKAKPSATPSPAVASKSERYPSIPDSTMQMLWEKCDFIDFIFYDLDFSMSQDQQNDIRGALKHISRAAPEINPACKPIGRIFFQVSGENVVEADIFLNAQCQYYLFYANGKKAYANALTLEGVQFYEYVFSRVTQQ